MAFTAEWHERIEELAGSWDDLADRAGPNPFVYPGWFGAWWTAFGAGQRLRILAIYRSGELVGLAPLVRVGSRLQSVTGSETPAFGFLTLDDTALQFLTYSLLRESPSHLALYYMDPVEVSAFLGHAVVAGPGYKVLSRVIMRSPCVAIDRDWDTYVGGLSKNLRKKVRRCTLRSEEEGEVSFDVSDGREGLDRLLEEGFRVEASGWKGQAGTAMSSRAETHTFYRELARWAAARGWLRLAFLRINGRAAAFDYCLERKGVHYLLKTGYDPAWQQLSPGTLLRYRMLARAFSEGIQIYDFLGDDVLWKRPWTKKSNDRLRVQAFAPSLPGRLGWINHAYLRSSARWMRDSADSARRALRGDQPARPH